MQAFFESFWQALMSTLGTGWSTIVSVILYLLGVYLFWGFFWDRILTKAGFDGKTHLTLFNMMFWPVAAIPPLIKWLNYESSLLGFLSVISSLSLYSGLAAIALLPWPIKRIKQQKPPAPRPNESLRGE
jgi:hypothetical protein